MRIGAVKFLNAYPLYWGLKFVPDLVIKKDIPSRLADNLLRHDLDIALISTIEYHRHRDLFKYYPELCIAARGRVDSIRLYLNSNCPANVKEIPKWLFQQDKLRIFYDVATRSSLSMLKVLLGEYCNNHCITEGLEFVQVAPPFEKLISGLGEQEMVLLIGDSALRLKEIPSIDMGEFYFQAFQRAFVYAIWVYREDTGRGAAELLLNAFEIGQKNIGEMITDAVAEFGFPEDFTRNYLTRTIQYKFSNELKNDLDFFFRKSENSV